MSKGRLLDDWLTGHLQYTTHSESPISFHAWAGISCICSALQRRVWMKWGHSIIYPNEYIILVGPSGRARKGEPVVIAKDIMDELRLPSVGEDNTKEAVIIDIENSMTSYEIGGKILFQCAVYCFVEELSVLLGEGDSKYLAYLTNWYDSRKNWKRTTKNMGTNEITGICFNLLASTAPDWLPMMLPKEAIGGGFTSRCIFVVEDRKSKVVANPNETPPDRRLFQRLVADLERISTVSGEVVFDKHALGFYLDWYTKQEQQIERGNPPVKDPLFAGYVSRRATHIKKIAMAMSFSRDNELVVKEQDISRALKMMEIAERNMSRAFTGVGRARYLEETEMVLDFIKAHKRVSKSDLLRSMYRQVDQYTLDIVISVLEGMKIVKSIRDTEHNEIYFKYLE